MHLTQALHRSLRQTPDQPATIFGDRVRTFADQADRVARLASVLRELGVSDGERVAILSPNSDRYAELLLAVPWAGGTLNPVNVRWSASEIIDSLVESETSLLVVDDAFLPVVPQLRKGHPGLGAVIHAGDGPAPLGVLSYEGAVASAAPIPDTRLGGDALAGLFYTGGTTGFAKGVMLTHTNLLTNALGSQVTAPAFQAGGRVLHAAPMFHLADLTTWITQSVVGGTHVIVPKFDPVAVMAAIDRHGVTTVLLVPTMLQALVDHPERGAFDLTTLRTILYAGSPVTELLVRRAMGALPHAEFVQAYGMTELGGISILTAEDHRRGDRLASAGRAAAHAEVRIVDGEGNEVPRGTVGEVEVRGGHVMAGYWGKPDETAAAIRDGWLHTGDGAYMDDEGYIFIVDRIKDMIITGGENVYSTEVENALGQHPSVAACAVIGLPDERWGERVHAIVVLKSGAGATPTELRAHTRRLIAAYKAPRSVEFVETLPLSGAGKVLKRALRARHGLPASRQVASCR
jgi:acyl-CoA synthetase (AMP-forming)/AMP-acid ligase II